MILEKYYCSGGGEFWASPRRRAKGTLLCSNCKFGESAKEPDLANNLYYAAQLLPGEVVADGVNRIAEVLENHGVKL